MAFSYFSAGRIPHRTRCYQSHVRVILLLVFGSSFGGFCLCPFVRGYSEPIHVQIERGIAEFVTLADLEQVDTAMHADLGRQSILMKRLADLATTLMGEKNRQRKVGDRQSVWFDSVD